jgi:hypothetical protein
VATAQRHSDATKRVRALIFNELLTGVNCLVSRCETRAKT